MTDTPKYAEEVHIGDEFTVWETDLLTVVS